MAMPISLLYLRTVSLLAALGVGLQAHGATVTVTTTNDDLINGDGQCTLREAMTAINNGADFQDCVHTGSAWGTTDTIAFAIGGAGPHVIQPASALSALTRTAVVDGYSQPGSSPNTLAGVGASAQGINAQIQIELDGVSAGSGVSGLVVNGANSLIQGLSIVRFGAVGGGAGILINGAGAQVYGNFLGLHADGVTSGGNGYGLLSSGAGATVGATVVAARRNVIAGNTVADLQIAATANDVAGNLICTDRTGQVAAGSGGLGVMIAADVNTVDSNTIAGCGSHGVLIDGGQSNMVRNSAIGIAAGGAALGNGGSGVLITNSNSFSSSANQVRTSQIAHNGGDGIGVQNINGWGDPHDNRLDGNAIWANGGLGINLIPAGEAPGVVTPNDAGDADTGPNGLANFPVVGSAVVNASGGVDIAFTLNGAANASVWISAYANDSCDPSGYGEGQYPTGSYSYNLDGAGNLSSTLSFFSHMPTGWAVGKWVTLLAHGATTGGTSEFSACAQITSAAPVAQVITNFAANPASGTVGGSSALSATGGGSGNPLVFGSSTPAVCTVSGSTVNYLSVGTCTVTADQSGDSVYAAAPQVSLNLTVSAGGGSPAAIPTLTEWALMLLSTLFVGLGIQGTRSGRRRQV